MQRPARCSRAPMWCRTMACDISCVLRHTFSVTAIQKGCSLPALQRLLGYDRLTTTKIYLNLLPEGVVWDFREKW